MGAGHHGGFGNTYGSKAISLSPIYAGDENNLKTASKWIAPKSGYTDIIVHGSPDHVEIKKGDCIGQAIFQKYLIVDNDLAEGERTGGFGSTSK